MNIVISIIIMIESGGNPLAFNKEHDARGLMQITPVVLREYNRFNFYLVTEEDLFNPEVNKKVGEWYLEKRIPYYLKAYNRKLTTENVLIAWNAGIKYAGRHRTPKEAKDYVKKYKKLLKERVKNGDRRE